jgi:opacity protein-like surface antigen
MSFLILMAASASAQAAPPVSPYYARTNTFSIFGAYSGDSSHILLGDAEDPVVHTVINQTTPVFYATSNDVQTDACVSGMRSYDDTITYNGKTVTYIGTVTTSCSRQWTIGEGISPVGFQWNFLPRQKLQPFFIGHGGYMYSTQPIPIPQAGSFNFTFDFGAGFELYRSNTKSIRAEYRYHHISNHNTANMNPGIDSGLFQVTYSFGR